LLDNLLIERGVLVVVGFGPQSSLGRAASHWLIPVNLGLEKLLNILLLCICLNELWHLLKVMFVNSTILAVSF
jgi:hypothetical protein